MASEIRVNQIQNRSGLSTVTFTDTGLVISGVTTISGSLNAPGGTTISAGSTSAPSISPVGDSNTGIFFPSADTVCIGEGGTEVIRVNSSGNVGVGTNNPASTLDVGGEITIRRTAAGNEGGQINFARASDNAVAWNIDAFGSTSTPSLRFIDSIAAVTRMEIDGSGRVVKPYQPAFLAFFSSSSDTTTNSGSVFAFDRVDFNVGGHFNTSTNRFVCPVAGIYAFSWAFFFTNSASNTQGMNVAFLVNGSQYLPSDGSTNSDALQVSTIPNSAGGYLSNSATYYIQLNANDYVQLYARGTNARIYQGHSHFSGVLLG